MCKAQPQSLTPVPEPRLAMITCLLTALRARCIAAALLALLSCSELFAQDDRPGRVFHSGWATLGGDARVTEERALSELLTAQGWPVPGELGEINERPLACYPQTSLIEALGPDYELYYLLKSLDRRVLLTGHSRVLLDFNKTMPPDLHDDGAVDYAMLFCGLLADREGYRFSAIGTSEHSALASVAPDAAAWKYIPPTVEARNDTEVVLRCIVRHQRTLTYSQLAIDEAGAVTMGRSSHLVDCDLPREYIHQGAIRIQRVEDIAVTVTDMRRKGEAKSPPPNPTNPSATDIDDSKLEHHLAVRDALAESSNMTFVYFSNGTKSDDLASTEADYDPSDSLVYAECKRAAQELIDRGATFGSLVLADPMDGRDRVELYAEGQQFQIHLRPTDESGTLMKHLLSDAGQVKALTSTNLAMRAAHLNDQFDADQRRKVFEATGIRARQGQPAAMYMLAYQYAYGIGTERDHAAAAEWAEKAATRGHARAMQMLGRQLKYGIGVTADEETSAKWMLSAAREGRSLAMEQIGSIYFFGNGFDVNLAEATRWFQRASDRGQHEATVMLGLCYRDGSGVLVNPIEAARLFGKAAAAGNGRGMLALGICFKDGVGVEPNRGTARAWFREAAAEGNSRALLQLFLDYENDKIDRVLGELDSLEEVLEGRKSRAQHSREMSERSGIPSTDKSTSPVTKDEARASIFRAIDLGDPDALRICRQFEPTWK
jgi:TPR repeat protein